MPWPRSIPDDYRTYMFLEPDPSLTDYDDIVGYALTIDGYRYASDVWHVVSDSSDFWDKVKSFRNGKDWQGSFEDLRCCLFCYQRLIRWIESGAFAQEEREEIMAIYKELCDKWPNSEAANG